MRVKGRRGRGTTGERGDNDRPFRREDGQTQDKGLDLHAVTSGGDGGSIISV